MPRERENIVDRFMRRAAQIQRAAREKGTLQVRWHEGMLITYRFPAPHGLGVRGALVAVYSADARLDWIEEDLLCFARSIGVSGETCTPATA